MTSADLATWFNSIQIERTDQIKLDFALAIDKAITDKNLTRRQVAERMRTSPAWVTKVLRGDVNLTIDSMAKLCNAVGYELTITLDATVKPDLAAKKLKATSRA